MSDTTREAAEKVCEAASDALDWTAEDLLAGRSYRLVLDKYEDARDAWRATQAQAQKEGEA
jgi:hypothetical protein